MRKLSVLLLFALLCACSPDSHTPAGPDLDAGPEEDVATPDAVSDVDFPEPDEIAHEDAPVGDGDLAPDQDVPLVTGPGPFAEGCPETGQALARRIETEHGFEGPAAIGESGDFLLANEHAAFVIEEAGKANAYYYYGGILVDAVALDGCNQAGPEQFEELGLMMGVLQLDLYSSTLRAFRAESVEVLADGSDGGPAIVRAVGTDDVFWTTELELLVEGYKANGDGDLSQPLNLEVTVDYILAPDSAVLTIETTYRNLGPTKIHILAAAEAQFGQTFQPHFYAWDAFAMSGFELKRSIPWMVASNGRGATAYAIEAGQLATLSIAGVTALFDAAQLETDVSIAPAGEDGDQRTTVSFVAVGATDANSATIHLHDVNPEPIPGKTYTLEPLHVDIVDAADGSPIDGAQVFLAAEDKGGKTQPLDSFVSVDGAVDGFVTRFAPDVSVSLSVTMTGYPQSSLLPLPVGDDLTDLKVELGPTGGLTYRVLGDDGNAIPAKLELRQDGSLKRRLWASADGWTTVNVVPGDYELSVTRGYEYAVHVEAVTIPTGAPLEFEVTLPHVVDTTGYLSLDTHLHAAPSSDSDIAVPHRLRTVAGEGVDVAVSTDHEAISDWSWAIAEAGLEGHVNTIIGQEVTCTLPEHINMFPVEQDFSVDARGGIPRWYGLDIDQIFGLLWDRGAQVVCLNHPRGGGGYMTLIEYDSVSGEPTLTDPTLLAWPEDASLWSWNFNAIELMNGPKMIFRTASSPHKTGHFDDWLGFHNLGHRVTALGSSDTHGEVYPGRSRSYVASSTDDPTQMDQDELAQAIDQGRVVVSAGAFLRVSVDGEAGPGETVSPADDVVDLAIHVEASPSVDVAWVKVYVNCDQVTTLAATSPDQVVKLDTKFPLKVTSDAHIVVAAFGTEPMPAALGNYTPSGVPRAISNPVFVDVDGNGLFDPPGPKSCSYDLEGP